MWISDRRRTSDAISRRSETTDDPSRPQNHGVFNMIGALVLRFCSIEASEYDPNLGANSVKLFLRESLAAIGRFIGKYCRVEQREETVFVMQNKIKCANNQERLAVSGILFERLLHDLKQPLNVIRIAAQGLLLDLRRDRLDIAMLPEDMSEIVNSVDQLVRRIEQLRIFTKPKLSCQTDDSVEVYRSCWKVLERIRQTYPEVVVTSELDEGLKVAMIDAFRFEQTLWELLDNGARAAESTPNGKGRLTLSARGNGDNIVIEVNDNGAGISETVKSSVFSPFVTTRDDGSGLGLALAKALVTQAGGHIELVDSSDEGSRFMIVLRRSSLHT